MDNSSLEWREFLAAVCEDALRKGGDWPTTARAIFEEAFWNQEIEAKLEEACENKEIEVRQRASDRSHTMPSVKAKKRLTSALLRELPRDLLKLMLSFLSAQDLCKYRLVCKDWNELVGSAKFGQQHAESRKLVAPALIVIRYVHQYGDYYGSTFRKHGWCFFDIKAREWYSMNDADEHMSRHNYNYGSYSVIDMDRGLFCHFSDWQIPVLDGLAITPKHVVVYNPTSKNVKNLPCPPIHRAAHCPTLTLWVDNVTHSFRVFLIDYEFDSTINDVNRMLIDRPSILQIYDSVPGTWKAAKNPVGIRDGIELLSSVVFKGLLYVFMTFFHEHGARSLNRLWTYDLAIDEWYNIPLQVPSEIAARQKLVCNENHLYLVGWSKKPQNTVTFSAILDSPWCYQVKEIIPGHPRLVTRFHMLESVMVSILEVHTGPGWIPAGTMAPPTRIQVIPYDDCLMLVSLVTGKVVIYDLNTGVFDTQLPKLLIDGKPNMSWVYGKHMNLMLPSTPWP